MTQEQTLRIVPTNKNIDSAKALEAIFLFLKKRVEAHDVYEVDDEAVQELAQDLVLELMTGTC